MIIKKEQYSFPEDRNWKRVIKFNSKSEDFIIALPEWTHEALRIQEVRAKTLDEAERKFNKAIEDYKEANCVETKVIKYSLKTTAYIFKDFTSNFGEGGGCILHTNEISFTDGACMEFSYYIAIKKQYPHNTTYKYIDGNTGHGEGDSCDKEMEWTPEREKFFRETEKSFNKLIVKAYEFFNQDEKDLLENINKGIRLIENKSDKK